jgi:hypothetical protein
MDTLPICKAKSKQSGQQCKNFATSGKLVCRIHGGKSTGARTSMGKYRQKTVSWKHGLRSKEAVEEARHVRGIIKECKQLIAGI